MNNPVWATFTFEAGTCYSYCGYFAPLCLENPNECSTLAFEIFGSNADNVIQWDLTAGWGVFNQTDAASVEYELCPSFTPTDMNGNVWTNTGDQVLDFSSLDWQQICINFTPSSTIVGEVFFSINAGETCDLVMDNLSIEECCTPPCTLIDATILGWGR